MQHFARDRACRRTPETQFGYHLIKVEEKKMLQNPALARKRMIKSRSKQQKQRRCLQQKVAELTEKYKENKVENYGSYSTKAAK